MARLVVQKIPQTGVFFVALMDVLLPNGRKYDYNAWGRDGLKRIVEEVREDRRFILENATN